MTDNYPVSKQSQPEVFKLYNIPIAREMKKEPIEQDTEDDDNKYVTYIETKKTPKNILKNRIFNQNLTTSSDSDPKNVKGNCVVITFWQLAKLSRCSYWEFMKLYEELINHEIEDKEIRMLCDIFIKPLWNRIYKGKIESWRMITNQNHNDAIFEYNGIKMYFYSLLENFIMYVNTLITGCESERLVEKSVQPTNKIDRYIEYLSQFTKTIPFVMQSGYQPMEDIIEVEKANICPDDFFNHIFIMVYDIEKDQLFNFDNCLDAPEKCPTNIYYQYVYCEDANLIPYRGLVLEIPNDITFNPEPNLDPDNISLYNQTDGIEYTSSAYSEDEIPNFSPIRCFIYLMQFLHFEKPDEANDFLTGLSEAIGIPQDDVNEIIDNYVHIEEALNNKSMEDWYKEMYTVLDENRERSGSNDIAVRIDHLLRHFIYLETGILLHFGDAHQVATFLDSDCQINLDQFNRYCKYCASRYRYIPFVSITFYTNYDRSDLAPSCDPVIYNIWYYDPDTKHFIIHDLSRKYGGGTYPFVFQAFTVFYPITSTVRWSPIIPPSAPMIPILPPNEQPPLDNRPVEQLSDIYTII